MSGDRFGRASMRLPTGKVWAAKSFSSRQLAAQSKHWPVQRPWRKERRRALKWITFRIFGRGLGFWIYLFRWTWWVKEWVFLVIKNRISYQSICSRFWGCCSLLIVSWFRFRFWLIQRRDVWEVGLWRRFIWVIRSRRYQFTFWDAAFSMGFSFFYRYSPWSMSDVFGWRSSASGFTCFRWVNFLVIQGVMWRRSGSCILRKKLFCLTGPIRWIFYTRLR